MLSRIKFNLFVLLCFLFVGSDEAFDFELTILIQAGQRECFHQIIEKNVTIEVEYEVIAGGDRDINYWLYSPSNRLLASDYKKSDGRQTFELDEKGEYRFCFDNSVSRFREKQVYFSLRRLQDAGHSDLEDANEDWMNQMDKDDLGELQSKTQDLKNAFQRIWNNMETAQRFQSFFRNHEVQDRLIIEKNFERVNFWSVIQMILMITVTIIQVVTIRSLFESRSAYGKFLRGKR